MKAPVIVLSLLSVLTLLQKNIYLCQNHTNVQSFINMSIDSSWKNTNLDKFEKENFPIIYIKKQENLFKVMTEEKCRYVIKHSHNLGGDTLRIGQNCTIEFDGGVISNGVIVGNNTKIIYGKNPVFSSIIIHGSWNVPLIKSSMFEDAKKENVLIQLFNLCNKSLYNKVIIEEGDYYVNAKVNNDGILRLVSNTEVVLNANIIMNHNGFQDYQIMAIYGADNIHIHGKGMIIGDLYEHNYETIKGTHEWGHGLTVRGCNNVLIEGITVKNCTGDACSIGAQAYGDLEKVVPVGVPSINIHLNNCRFEASRRQGLTITFASFVTVDNCIFDGIFNTFRGTAPGAGIDVEPDNNGNNEIERGNEVNHIIIKNCIFNNCNYGILSWKSDDKNDSRWFRDIKIENCSFNKINQICYSLKGFDNVYIRNTIFLDSSTKYRFDKCKKVIKS